MPVLPRARGPLSTAVLDVLAGRRAAADLPSGADVGRLEPDTLGDDLQLALYCCYELHYRSFDGVDDALEWDPHLLTLRAHRSDVRGRFLTDANVAARGSRTWGACDWRRPCFPSGDHEDPPRRSRPALSRRYRHRHRERRP